MKSGEEKSRREKEKESEDRRTKIQAREMLGKARNTVFSNDLRVGRVEK